MDLWKKLGLKLELHVSTQASSLNYEVVKFYKELGATRVVLAREASKNDIKRIKDETKRIKRLICLIVCRNVRFLFKR
jgi:putative protease